MNVFDKMMTSSGWVTIKTLSAVSGKKLLPQKFTSAKRGAEGSRDVTLACACTNERNKDLYSNKTSHCE